MGENGLGLVVRAEIEAANAAKLLRLPLPEHINSQLSEKTVIDHRQKKTLEIYDNLIDELKKYNTAQPNASNEDYLDKVFNALGQSLKDTPQGKVISKNIMMIFNLHNCSVISNIITQHQNSDFQMLPTRNYIDIKGNLEKILSDYLGLDQSKWIQHNRKAFTELLNDMAKIKQKHEAKVNYLLGKARIQFVNFKKLTSETEGFIPLAAYEKYQSTFRKVYENIFLLEPHQAKKGFFENNLLALKALYTNHCEKIAKRLCNPALIQLKMYATDESLNLSYEVYYGLKNQIWQVCEALILMLGNNSDILTILSDEWLIYTRILENRFRHPPKSIDFQQEDQELTDIDHYRNQQQKQSGQATLFYMANGLKKSKSLETIDANLTNAEEEQSQLPPVTRV